MEPGEYFVGDLCYVMEADWDEFCAITMPEGQCLDGEFTLSDGRKFSFSRTAYGDGSYEDQWGNSYDVDAGLIGCIKIKDIKPEMPLDRIKTYGSIFTFAEPFEVEGSNSGDPWDGVIVISNVYIDTDPEDDTDVENEEDE